MTFGGFQKLTLLDYPEKVACILFTKGCNFRCPFCHNAYLVELNQYEYITDEEVLNFLKKRQGILEGVCISGGEPLLHKDLEVFMKEVKSLGYPIKLDTNGSFPKKLKSLCEKGLIDYVAMDIKNTFEKYQLTSGIKGLDIVNIKESIEFLLNGNIDYEFRTTVVNEFHTVEDIEKISSYIKGAKKYFLQNFVNSGHILGENLHPVEKNILEEMQKSASQNVPNARIRGEN